MPAIATIVLGLFVTAGLAISGFGLHTLWRDHSAAAWPHVPGWITGSEVIDTSDSDGSSYKPGIRYHYAVDGQEYDGQRISFGTDRLSSSGSFAAKYTQKYPVGKEVRVAYQPAQPSVSVLETGLRKQSFFQVAFGLGFTFFALWFWLLTWLING